MNDADRAKAAKALMRWFDSQDIMPPDAAVLMIEVLASCLIDKTKDIRKLQESCENFKLGLVLNIALMLKESYP
jgi:hypothetical protein